MGKSISVSKGSTNKVKILRDCIETSLQAYLDSNENLDITVLPVGKFLKNESYDPDHEALRAVMYAKFCCYTVVPMLMDLDGISDIAASIRECLKESREGDWLGNNKKLSDKSHNLVQVYMRKAANYFKTESQLEIAKNGYTPIATSLSMKAAPYSNASAVIEKMSGYSMEYEKIEAIRSIFNSCKCIIGSALQRDPLIGMLVLSELQKLFNFEVATKTISKEQ